MSWLLRFGKSLKLVVDPKDLTSVSKLRLFVLLCIRRGVEGVGREVQALMPRWVWKYVSPEIEIVNSDFQPGQGGKSFPGKRHWSFYDGKGRWKPFSKPNKVTRLQWEARVCQVKIFEPGPRKISREANFNLFLISLSDIEVCEQN